MALFKRFGLLIEKYNLGIRAGQVSFKINPANQVLGLNT